LSIITPPIRPAEAAGLVLIRQAQNAAGGAEVLLGRRSQRSRFMPGVYVFPGGRLSALDRRASGFAEDLAPLPAGLDARTRHRLAVFARAALRETFEETGLLLGLPAPATAPADAATTRVPNVWAAFARAGLAPAFSALGLVARAITPTASPLRFHTRFFLADGANAHGPLGGDGELEDIRWVPVTAAPALPIPEVTLRVLEEALARRAEDVQGASGARPATLFRWVGPEMWPRAWPGPLGRRA
jgi:8-oxo-dGTP pyrophosphatase MutT (NUDIX family)